MYRFTGLDFLNPLHDHLFTRGQTGFHRPHGTDSLTNGNLADMGNFLFVDNQNVMALLVCQNRRLGHGRTHFRMGQGNQDGYILAWNQ